MLCMLSTFYADRSKWSVVQSLSLKRAQTSTNVIPYVGFFSIIIMIIIVILMIVINIVYYYCTYNTP